MIELARELCGSGISALVAVSNAEKSLINSLEEKLQV